VYQDESFDLYDSLVKLWVSLIRLPLNWDLLGPINYDTRPIVRNYFLPLPPLSENKWQEKIDYFVKCIFKSDYAGTQLGNLKSFIHKYIPHDPNIIYMLVCMNHPGTQEMGRGIMEWHTYMAMIRPMTIGSMVLLVYFRVSRQNFESGRVLQYIFNSIKLESFANDTIHTV